jgi:hypothetical protein
MIEDPSPIADPRVRPVAMEAYEVFNDVLDYVWKAPSLIEHQKEIELRKLSEFQPDESWIRDFRWHLESKKLHQVFPWLMASGNLFTVVSLFEVYLLRIARIVETHAAAGASVPQRSQGVQRAMAVLRGAGIEPSGVRLWPQVEAALKIRHCLMHAGGILVNSRDEREIQRLAASHTYLAPEHRQRRIPDEPPMVSIVYNTALGDRLEITNYYAWLAAAYLRDAFTILCRDYVPSALQSVSDE